MNATQLVLVMYSTRLPRLITVSWERATLVDNSDGGGGFVVRMKNAVSQDECGSLFYFSL